MANENDTGYDPREFELVGGKRAPRPSAEFMADPDVQAQMKFNDFINSPEGMKLLREMHEKALAAADTIDKYEHRADRQAVRQGARELNRNTRNLRSETEDVSRRVMADEQAKLAPQYSKPLATDTE
tara:strand:+ start:4285 stop:4665 length:381 start_codon:yes stop_codon:yes gene_type:complete